MSKRIIVTVAWLQLAAICTAVTASQAQNAALDWSLKAQQVVTAGRPPASSEYLLALVHAAMYDAAVAVEGRYKPFGVAVPLLPSASSPAAVAAAAYHVLVVRVPGAPSLDDDYQAYVAAIDDGPAKEAGLAVGAAVAIAWLEMRSGDGFDNVVPYVQPPPGPGVFEPVAPTTPVDVKMAQVQPYAMPSNDWFRPWGPPSLASRQYARAFEEVYEVGRVQPSLPLPPAQETALFWAENTAIQWNRNLRTLSAAAGLDLVDTARLLALVHVASADALVGCFEAKYHFMAWRPVHAIARADTDGNRWTSADSGWAPLLTVNHPEYPAAHGCWTTAVTEAMAFLFGRHRLDIPIDSTVTGTTRVYRSFREIAEEIADARISAGLHFRFSTDDGAAIGRSVAALITRRHFRPLSPGRSAPD
jgi:hypothetical protein